VEVVVDEGVVRVVEDDGLGDGQVEREDAKVVGDVGGIDGKGCRRWWWKGDWGVDGRNS